LDKYGVENVSQLEEIKKKKIDTLMDNYGVDCAMFIPGMIDQVNEKKRKTCLEKYGVDNVSKTLECREIFRNKMLDYLENQLPGHKVIPVIGNYEPDFFGWLQNFSEYKIVRPDRMHGLFPDGYIKDLKLVIEFDEPDHATRKGQLRDQIKDETYKKYHLNIFRVSQEEWQIQPEITKQRFLNIIESIRRNK
jgi:very-short-patch-repair endonuclease